MMFAVLDQLDREGGKVSRQRFLEIGEENAYNRRGMARLLPATRRAGSELHDAPQPPKGASG